MIAFILAGIGALGVIAIAVGIIDARQGATRRMVAAERRARWEARQLDGHDTVLIDDPGSDD